jgi:hypothetical protein
MHKESFITNCNTLLHVSTLLGHLQGEVFVTVTLGCTIQLSENVLLTVHCAAFEGVKSSRLQYTVNSTFSLNCIVQP